MASLIYFLDAAAKPLLGRDFRGDIPFSAVQNFHKYLPSHPEPCFAHGEVQYLYLRHTNVILLAVARSNINAASIFVFLTKLLTVLTHYVKNVAEESIRDNHVILYEMLDEMCDYGHPQITDLNVLQDFISQTPYQLQALGALTSDVAWRPPGIFYKKNELFVDVIETYDAIMEADGTLSNATVSGHVGVKSYLSGMPHLKLAINDLDKSSLKEALDTGEQVSRYKLSRYVALQDLSFHQCVDLIKFELDRTIEFIPPDGNFDLMSYRVSPTKPPPFKIDVSSTIKDHSRVIIRCEAVSTYRKRQACTYVEIHVPVPPDGDSPKFKCSMGTMMYSPEDNVMIWRIKNFKGDVTASMTAQLMLPSIGVSAPPKAPVLIKFELPSMAYSGLEIRSIKVHEDQLKYSTYPWVRYLTKTGEYEVRRKHS